MTAPVSPASDEFSPADASPDAAPPAFTVPDRADAPVSEVTERFLRQVIAEVPIDRIEELHLFSPLRQGTVETGIAVLAARVLVPVPAHVAQPEPELALGDDPADVEPVAMEPVEVEPVELEAVELEPVELEAVEEEPADTESVEMELAEAVTADAEPAILVDEDAPADDARVVAVEEPVEAPVASTELVAGESGDDEDTAPEAVVHDQSVVGAEAADDELVIADVVPDAPKPVVRHTVYTARYRYVIKGPERGKWEASVKAEADAPLITVETVVRGVQRRAGEESEIIRYTGAQIARALRIPMPPTEQTAG